MSFGLFDPGMHNRGICDPGLDQGGIFDVDFLYPASASSLVRVLKGVVRSIAKLVGTPMSQGKQLSQVQSAHRQRGNNA